MSTQRYIMFNETDSQDNLYRIVVLMASRPVFLIQWYPWDSQTHTAQQQDQQHKCNKQQEEAW